MKNMNNQDGNEVSFKTVSKGLWFENKQYRTESLTKLDLDKVLECQR